MTATIPGSAASALRPGRYATPAGRVYRVAASHRRAGELVVYPGNGRQAVAVIRGGQIRWASVARVHTDLTGLLADPASWAGRYATLTGRCARCRRPAADLDHRGLGVECRKDGR